jgi:hypothetical protein
MAESDWSDAENDLIVADYFDMLHIDLAGSPYNKAERNRNLQTLLADRSRGSVEFKHQNISAVLLGLGEPWIPGYKPASRFQLSLIDAVCRRLETKSAWHQPNSGSLSEGRASTRALREPNQLRLDMPPTLKNAPSPIEPQFMAMIARKYDVAARDERNRDLGRAGEERILQYESDLLKDSGRYDLAKKIVWTSQVDGDGAGYDIASFEPDGKPRLIEVKTTNGWERTPFHISRNELAVAEQLRDHWCLVRLWNFAREPKAFEIRPPLDAHVTLTPTSFLASIQ